LNICHNEISVLPEEIGRLTKLEHLYFGMNRNISEIPDQIANCVNLKGLDLGSTNISVLPEWIGSLSELVGINIGGANISWSTVLMNLSRRGVIVDE
ncbi:MAG: hypothetical protein LBQ43_01020, partial [Holosporales bacterium]|jgi:Leucine-rich repeat (LRR) protein|nr:hypothetical protein [Holosporales bacterium]